MKPSRILWLCNSGMVCVAVGVSLLSVYLTTFSEAFGGLSEGELGRLPALLFAGFVAGILVSGPLADRFGGKLFAVTGMGLSAAGLLALALARDYTMLLAACCATGFGAGVLDMVVSPIVSVVCPDRRAAALNRLHAFYSIGAVGTILVAYVCLRAGVYWRWVIGGFALMPAMLMVGFLRATVPPLVHPDHTREGLRVLLLRPRFYVALVMIALVGATEAGMAQWLPAYSEQVLGYSKATGAMALACFAVAMGTGRLLASRAARYVSPHGLVGTGALLCAGFYVVGAWAPSPPVALAACVSVGLGCSLLWPTNLGIAADRFPRGGASMFAFVAAAGNAGCLVAPWVEGVVAESRNLQTAFFVAACCPVLLALVTWLTKRADRRASV